MVKSVVITVCLILAIIIASVCLAQPGLQTTSSLDAFNEYGVQIMTPAYEGDPDQLKVVPKDQWFAAPAQPPEDNSEEAKKKPE